jgi:hypothetical protein
MCGEYFYICHGEEIAIFSAEHDKFITITYDQAAKADVRFKRNDDGTKNGPAQMVSSGTTATAWTAFDAEKDANKLTAHQTHPPILIFRPFQTVSLRTIFCCVYTITPLTLNDSFLPTLP